ncbi:acyltransferase [Bradyrhizobium sp. BRP22]|uniref:acyltransferase family protein n=1 Tax=Bradyrhizobium sp. BRP22 TaxID=2793821 RepID=UPI0023DE84AB|nr:acyltransferase family protein [Bradyrhizobium sp. BRP22]MCA1452965.1 acyltransferase [Bradyrhizobium sp. BRP22]
MFLDLAKECTHALLSIANIQYWRESYQYFARTSDELALLHFWSLSLEEQFYLVWPALIVLAYRSGRLREIILLVTTSSLLGAFLVGRIDPSAAFFLMPFRIFEFGCGALMLFVDEHRLSRIARESLAAFGMLFIAAGAVFLRPTTANLEVMVLIPCLGAAATILAGENTVTSRSLSHPIVAGIGTISYSLYLCHWPIIFFGRFIFGESADGWTGTLTMLPVMIIVATLMYRFIERRFIQRSGLGPADAWKNAFQFGAIIIPLVTITHLTFLSKGFAWRLPESRLEHARLNGPSLIEDIEPFNGSVGFQLVGDSHAHQYGRGIEPLMKRMSIRMEVLGSAGCPMLQDITLRSRNREGCIQARDQALARMRETRLPVIFVQRWDIYDDAAVDYHDSTQGRNWTDERNSYSKLEHALTQTLVSVVEGRQILLIGAQVDASCEINRPRLLQGPLLHAPLPPCPPSRKEDVERSGSKINAMLSRVQAKWPDRIELLRPVDYFCGAECPVVAEGYWLYWDRTHFSLAGSRYMVERAKEPFGRLLARSAP